ncbi:MAG: D-alanyl-D-alanine carboxypeptidase/D-alanyl-D-alanine-endopeptidase [Steroidobacteraceae bacterium]|jgi:D-alanyl-D-alanine carboxypeptidase/D-alanyl-D-alanine-endopeptidase (penicillin-binding protein 4)|nr:D-alanyl-D-alanine carboxypeptidase/D-alanyl-D-alanine-endopeptidase [Steroidobacteraceae bacterium]
MHRAARLLAISSLGIASVAIGAAPPAAPPLAGRPPAGGREAPAAYAAALREAGIPQRSAAVVVEPLDAGGLTLAENADGAMSPASTMKLVTTWAALNLLGPAYVWRTEVYAAGTLTDGSLDGALVFRGGGDPTLVIENLWLLVQRIRAAGVREIRGDVVLDRTAFAPVPHDPEDFDGAGDRAYNAGPDALLVNFKALSFDFVPDPAAGVARIVATPQLAGMALQQTVRGSDGACGDWRAALRGDVSNPLAPVFRGSYPLACGTRSWHVNALDPTPYFSAVFRALWEQGGGRWSGRAREGPLPAGARLLAWRESRPLAEVIRDINKFSNNVMARQLFLTIGAEAGGRPATTARAAEAVRAFLADRGQPMPELVLDNGSGLSRRERIAPANLAAMLADAWRSPLMPELVASLPITGIDGTTRTRRAAAGAAHVKTGMLNDVRAIAGYLVADSGRRYAIVAVINHPAARGAQRAHDALLDWLRRNG